MKTADHRYSNFLEPILNWTKITIPPIDRVPIRTSSQLYPENSVNGILQPSDLVHEEDDITYCPTIVTLNNGNTQIPVNNLIVHPHILKKALHFPKFSVLTPDQMKYVKPVDPVSTWLLLQNDQKQAAHYVSSPQKKRTNIGKTQKTTGSLPRRSPETPTNIRLFRSAT